MATTTNLLVTKIEASQSQKETTANEAFDVLDKAIAGAISKAITAADVTLTDVEAQAAIITLTGALTGNRALIVPARTKIYLINNTTTGAFAVTVKTSGGTGVIVLQGTRQIVYCDGTNVVQLGGQSTQTNTPATNAVVNSFTIGNNSSGTPAAGLGTGVLLQGETSTTPDTDMARVAAVFQNVTHASRVSYLALATVSNGGSLVDRIITGPRKALTDGVAVSLFEVALPTLAGASGVIAATIYCSDGSDVQVRSTVVRFSAVNKAGAYTTEIVEVSSALSASAGTLDDTWTILNGTNKVTIQLAADTSLTPTTFYVTFTLENNSEQAITVV